MGAALMHVHLGALVSTVLFELLLITVHLITEPVAVLLAELLPLLAVHLVPLLAVHFVELIAVLFVIVLGVHVGVPLSFCFFIDRV